MAPMPESQMVKGVELGKQVVKVDGKLVVAFVGFSNFRQEGQAFTKLMREERIRGIVWFNACRGNWDLRAMVDRADEYWAWVKAMMVRRNISLPQIQVLFVKNSVRGGASIQEFKALLGKHLARAAVELPFVTQVFLLSAVYSGYAGPGSPRTEPGAYYEGKAVNEYIQEHYGRLPWTAWSAYLWADGLTEREDGLIWTCSDFELRDGVHPDTQAENKVAEMLYRFMRQSPTTGWFTDR
jgi:hypothetical protein